MRILDLFENDRNIIDNRNGWGAVPNNQEVDYLGLRVTMTPKTFIDLAAPLGVEPSQEIQQHLEQGGTIGAPFLRIEIPESWKDGDFSMPARVVGHEGRNRMAAVAKVFGNNPIETHLFFSQGLRNRHITDDFKKHLNKILIKEKSKTLVSGPFFTLNEAVLDKKNTNEDKKLGLTIFDIDETLMRTTAKIKVVKNGREIRSLTNQEFNSYELKPGEEYDFGEFRNAEKFQKESEPIGPMIAKLKAILKNAGDSKVIMLTARADFDNKETFLDTFRRLGIDMSRVHVHRAGNLGMAPAESKAVWIRKYLDTGKYGRVRLYDDSMGNIKMFNALSKEYPDVVFYPYLVTHDGKIKTVREYTTETFDTEAEWVLGYEHGAEKVFATKIDDAYIELTYKEMTNGDLYISFTRGGRMAVTGEGNQNKIFGAVINHIKSHVAQTKPRRLMFSAFKPNTGPFGSQDTTRSSLYRKMVQRFASQNGYDFDVEDTGSEDTFILTQKNSKNTQERYTAREWAIISGGHSLEEVKPKRKPFDFGKY